MAVSYAIAPGVYRFGDETFRRVMRLKEDFFSCNEVLEDEQGRQWVLKISRFLYVHGLAGGAARYLSKREQVFYHRLQGVRGIPDIHPFTGPNFLLHAFIPGDNLQKRREVDQRFFDELVRLVVATHERGVASADLSKKANVIVGDDGLPYLIDFQISMGLQRPTGPFARAANALTRQLMAEDLYHVYKHKRRLRPDLLRDWERPLAYRKSLYSRLHRVVLGKPYLALKRRVFPHGSHEMYLFRKPKEEGA